MKKVLLALAIVPATLAAQQPAGSPMSGPSLVSLVSSLPDSARPAAHALLTAPDSVSQVRAVSEISRLGAYLARQLPAYPSTGEFFRGLATSDRLPTVRRSALSILELLYRDRASGSWRDPDVGQLAMRLARSDTSSIVRSAALRSIALGASSGTDAAAVLLNAIRNDTSLMIRLAAIGGMASPTTTLARDSVELLRRLATGDRVPEVRRAALGVLQALYWDRTTSDWTAPFVGPLALQVLRSDTSTIVQSSAIQMLAARVPADTAATAALFGVLRSSGSALLRSQALRVMTDPRFHGPALETLQERIVNDPDTVVVRLALDALQNATVRPLQTALTARLASAKAANDSAMLRVLAESQDNFVHRSMVAPKFVRNPPKPFAAKPANAPIRVLAFGDYGQAHLPHGRDHQLALAKTIRTYHTQRPFGFGITTGDNFYPTSFPSPTDTAWRVSWSEPYDPLGIRFYISLGNHDWGEPAGPLSQHIYGTTSKSWTLPAFYYTYTAGAAQFFAVNTNALTEKQLDWLRRELKASTARWKIVYGHHPIIEQTNYGVTEPSRLLLPVLKEGGAHMFVAGHHHSMQHWIEDGVDFVVSGAGGAGNYALGDTLRVDPRRRFMASRPGFAELSVSTDRIGVRFVGMGTKGEPALLYEYARPAQR